MEVTFIGALVVILLGWFVISLVKMIVDQKTIDSLEGNMERFKTIADVEAQVEKLEKAASDLDKEYEAKRATFDSLKELASVYDETISMAEMGLYRPIHTDKSPEAYKIAIAENEFEQKQMISEKEAVYGDTNWTVGGSKAKGKTMINQSIKLALRSFNNECTAAAATMRWNNASRIVTRVQKAYTSINKLNSVHGVEISEGYLELKIEALKLNHEYLESVQELKIEQDEARRLMREEAALQKEVAATEKDEEIKRGALNCAEAEIRHTQGRRFDELTALIVDLTRALEEAKERTTRAKSMAEQTKIGHVYVISNVGSFGANVYKIGMTRRLEPEIRVNELGGASVPFRFSIHAMIYSEDAPALEKALHNALEDCKVNKANNRKEFFRVSFDGIRQATADLDLDAKFTEVVDDAEYQETLAIIEERKGLEDCALPYKL